jgi:hypothetical protein
MDRQLRDLLDTAVGEPPHEVSVEAVRRRVTRRRVREAVGIPVAVAVLAAAGVTAATGVFGVVPGPAAGHRPATVYVSYPGKYHFSEALARISTATNTAGKPIRIGTLGGLAFTPDGKTAYVEGHTGAIIPISTATNTPGQPIPVPMPGYLPFNITMNPDGKTAYLTFTWSIGSKFSGSIVPFSTATNTPGRPIRVYSGTRPYVVAIVFSPGGKTAYVAAGSLGATPPTLLNPATVTPINTATGTPGQPIRLSHGESDITITPDGKTLYVAGPDTITPVSTATGTPGPPIRVGTGAGTMAITPDGKTLYVDSDGPAGGAIVPISTATNRPGQPIPVAADDIAITPDGKTLYAAARQGVVPISTATNTPGKPIRPAGYRGVPMLWISP